MCRDVEDVAAIHVKALSPSVPGNERYLFHSRDLLSGDKAAHYIREKYPELKNRVPAGDVNVKSPPNMITTDISKGEAAFGSTWKSWQDTVTDLVNDIILFEKEGRVEEDDRGVAQMKI
jgi:NADPH-dependent methylglyoxal reductase